MEGIDWDALEKMEYEAKLKELKANNKGTITQRSNAIDTKQCIFCEETLPICRFPRSHVNPQYYSPLCIRCFETLRKRLVIVSKIDRKICKRLGLDYERVLEFKWEYPKYFGF